MFRSTIPAATVALVSLFFADRPASAQLIVPVTPYSAPALQLYYNYPPYGNYAYPAWYRYYWNLGYFRPYYALPNPPRAYSYGNGTITATDAAFARGYVRVILPSADASVWLNGGRGQLTGTDRVFRSPPLETAQDYTYTVLVRWIEDGRAVETTREVVIRAGETSTVDFRNPKSELIPVAPKKK